MGITLWMTYCANCTARSECQLRNQPTHSLVKRHNEFRRAKRLKRKNQMDSRTNNNILLNTASTETSTYPMFQPVPGLDGPKYQPYTNQYQHQSGDVQQTNQPIP